MHIRPERHWARLHEQKFLNVVTDLCHFIMHKVINVRGKYFHKAQKLAMDPKYTILREWDNLEHRTAPSSVHREYRRKYVLNVNFNDAPQ